VQDFLMPNHSFDGLRIIANPYTPETVKQQFKFPRSKKKRIRKKWARNPKYRREVPAIWQMDGYLIMHPKTYARLMERFKKEVTARESNNTLSSRNFHLPTSATS
jgi:hypothetical protein